MEWLYNFLFSAVFAVYLFIKAPKYNKNRWLWAVLGYFLTIFALCIFFIQTGRKSLGWILFSIIALLLIVGALLVFGILYFFGSLKG
ncbi:hypothetical protein ACTSEZ_01180 [Metabacillus sp. JX24]|uniref:hypothetical protein n=1 Tax=Metabacillus sp. JX24 TaxID=3240759 RepID=UPI003510ADD9